MKDGQWSLAGTKERIRPRAGGSETRLNGMAKVGTVRPAQVAVFALLETGFRSFAETLVGPFVAFPFVAVARFRLPVVCNLLLQLRRFGGLQSWVSASVDVLVRRGLSGLSFSFFGSTS